MTAQAKHFDRQPRKAVKGQALVNELVDMRRRHVQLTEAYEASEILLRMSKSDTRQARLECSTCREEGLWMAVGGVSFMAASIAAHAWPIAAPLCYAIEAIAAFVFTVGALSAAFDPS